MDQRTKSENQPVERRRETDPKAQAGAERTFGTFRVKTAVKSGPTVCYSWKQF